MTNKEASNDCIYRQDAIDAAMRDVSDKRTHDFNAGATRAANRIKSLPPAQPERKKGTWMRITQGAMPEQYICPFCHRTVESYGAEELLPIRYPYCHCGADMRGEQDE